MRNLALATPLAAFTLVFLLGCGGGSQGSDPPAAPPDQGTGDAVLLLEPKVVEAPASLRATVMNRGDKTLTYGVSYAIERKEGEVWRKTDIAPEFFTQQALGAPPGGPGPSHRVTVPENVEPGVYRVTKGVTRGGLSRDAKTVTVRAQFEVR